MYIDQEYYSSHGGREMSSAAFLRNEFRARKLVDRITQSRIQTMQEVPEAVKMLMVELVGLEENQRAEREQAPAVKSFSNDGYSETYAETLTAEEVEEIEHSLILDYLSGENDDNGTPLLYLGVDV